MAINEPQAPCPFGLMLRRPGDVANPDADPGAPDEYEGIYLAPDFTARHAKHDTRAGIDPRWGQGKADQWSLSLPHSCGEWEISDGTREDVLADALRLRDELDQAIAALQAEEALPQAPAWHYKITPVADPAEVEPSAPWPPEGTAGVDLYVGGRLVSTVTAVEFDTEPYGGPQLGARRLTASRAGWYSTGKRYRTDPGGIVEVQMTQTAPRLLFDADALRSQIGERIALHGPRTIQGVLRSVDAADDGLSVTLRVEVEHAAASAGVQAEAGDG
jgi:hypothetical protein